MLVFAKQKKKKCAEHYYFGRALSLPQHSIVKLPSAVSPIRSGISCSSSNLRSMSCLSAPFHVLALVTLVLHPCQQASAHLACTRPPYFVASRRSLTFFLRQRPVLLDTRCNSCWKDSPRRTQRGRPRTQGHMHLEERIVCRSSHHLLRP
jgi:hypothetical protein